MRPLFCSLGSQIRPPETPQRPNSTSTACYLLIGTITICHLPSWKTRNMVITLLRPCTLV